MLFSCCEGKFGVPLLLQRVSRESLDLHKGSQVLLSSFERELGIAPQ